MVFLYKKIHNYAMIMQIVSNYAMKKNYALKV